MNSTYVHDTKLLKEQYVITCTVYMYNYTVEPLTVDTSEIRTPLQYGHLLLSQLW